MIFLVFMVGNFILNRGYILSSLVVPLLVFVLGWSWYIDKEFRPLSKFVSLSSVFEVQRGEETEDVARLRMGHPVTWSQRYDPFISTSRAITNRYVPFLRSVTSTGGDMPRMTIRCMLHQKTTERTT